MPATRKQISSGSCRGGGLGREQFPDVPPEHLPRGHSPATCSRLKLHRLPAREQQGEFNNFLVDTGDVGRNAVE